MYSERVWGHLSTFDELILHEQIFPVIPYANNGKIPIIGILDYNYTVYSSNMMANIVQTLRAIKYQLPDFLIFCVLLHFEEYDVYMYAYLYLYNIICI